MLRLDGTAGRCGLALISEDLRATSISKRKRNRALSSDDLRCSPARAMPRNIVFQQDCRVDHYAVWRRQTLQVGRHPRAWSESSTIAPCRAKPAFHPRFGLCLPSAGISRRWRGIRLPYYSLAAVAGSSRYSAYLAVFRSSKGNLIAISGEPQVRRQTLLGAQDRAPRGQVGAPPYGEASTSHQSTPPGFEINVILPAFDRQTEERCPEPAALMSSYRFVGSFATLPVWRLWKSRRLGTLRWDYGAGVTEQSRSLTTP